MLSVSKLKYKLNRSDAFPNLNKIKNEYEEEEEGEKWDTELSVFFKRY